MSNVIKGHIDYGNGAGPKPPVAEEAPAEIRNTADLRSVLLDEIKALRAGNSDAGQAKAIASLAKSVIDLVRLDMEYRRVRKEDAALADEMAKPVALIADA